MVKTLVSKPYRKSKRRNQGKSSPMSMDKLSKMVMSLRKKDKVNTVYNQLIGALNLNVEGPVNAYHLDKFTSLTPAFGMNLSDGFKDKIINYSDQLRVNVDLANGILSEEDKINVHMFLVSLTDEIGSAFNASTGVLTLTAGTHYYTNAGLFVLNQKCFKIHSSKRFFLDNHGIALTTSTGQTQYGTNIGLDFYIKRKQLVKTSGGDWISTLCPPDASKNCFLLIFNDNSTVDAEYPSLNLVHKKTVQSY